MKTSSIEIINSAVKAEVITEQQINLITKRLNSGEKIDLSEIWDNPLRLTPEQNKKGIDFLRNLNKTPTGKERLNNPFGYREEEALNTFEYFEFAGVYDAGNYNNSYFVPLYNCVGSLNSFQYYYNGKLNIVG